MIKQTQLKFKVRRFFRKPIATYTFFAIQLLMFLLMTLDGGSTNIYTLIQYGAKFNPLIVEGEWWRLITPVFLHIGWMHLLMNSVILYYLGTQLESLLGAWRFALIYLMSALSGNLASFAFNQSISAGASTALFGLFGVALYLGKVYTGNPAVQQMAKSFGTLILINLVFGFFSSSIDLAGHIGGLAGGYLIATAISVKDPLPRWKKQRIQFGLLFAAMVILLFIIGYMRTTRLF